MAHFGHVNSYDANAPLPVVGTRWVWEIDSPSARSVCEVTTVKWNGEEWFVETKTLMPDSFPSHRDRHWNDIGRFWEAVTIVGGGVTGKHAVRRPGLAIEGQESTL